MEMWLVAFYYFLLFFVNKCVVCLLVDCYSNDKLFLADPIRTNNGRIVGGRQISIEEVPYQISIQIGNHHKCGGSIISNKHVLTAAHCVRISNNTQKFTIRAGSANRQVGGTIYKVINIISHNYTMSLNSMPINDIALLEVTPPFQFGKLCAPVLLFDLKEKAPPGSIAIISGWGRTFNHSKSIYLEAAEVPMISKVDCKKVYKNLPEGEICAMHSLGKRDSCQGDSGGPLVIDKRLAGIISWGFGCGIKGKPGVYTEVAYYANWIKRMQHYAN